MSYSETEVLAAVGRMEKYRAGQDGEISAALAVVGLSSERADKETAIRDDMIRVAHRAGASLRQIAEVSGLNRKTVSNIVESEKQDSRTPTSRHPLASHIHRLNMLPGPPFPQVTALSPSKPATASCWHPVPSGFGY